MKAEDTAFILFTSGSTGRPKGVELSHRAVSAFVRWTAREFQITSGDRIACPSPLGFDLSTFDIFNMALCGATAVLVPDNIVWMPRFLVQFVRESRISCWYSVPSILAGMLQSGAHGSAFLSRSAPDSLCRRGLSRAHSGPIAGRVPCGALRESLWPHRDQRGDMVPRASLDSTAHNRCPSAIPALMP
jgi:non-ribosomal peptide synthetase component F